ncbi:hypothetical protein GCM10027259_28840 [Micromonospora palomenae]
MAPGSGYEVDMRAPEAMAGWMGARLTDKTYRLNRISTPGAASRRRPAAVRRPAGGSTCPVPRYAGQGAHGCATVQVLSAAHRVGVFQAVPPAPLLSHTSES